MSSIILVSPTKEWEEKALNYPVTERNPVM